MVQRRVRRAGGSSKRFSVTLDQADYDRLVELGWAQRPPLTLQYLVEYAIQNLLRQAADPQFTFPFAEPAPRAQRGPKPSR